MKKLNIKTSKGEFVVMDKDNNEFIDYACKYDFIKLSDITEEQTKQIINYGDEFTLKNYTSGKEKLFKVIKSKGYNLFENPIDLDEVLECSCDICENQLQERFETEEEKTFYKPYIFKIC